jgi:hypothetical protein
MGLAKKVVMSRRDVSTRTPELSLPIGSIQEAFRYGSGGQRAYLGMMQRDFAVSNET